MKKSILTLMFVLAFVCGGLCVSEVRASTRLVKNTKSESTLNVNGSKEMSRNELINKINQSFAKMKKVCKSNFFNGCDNAINNANWWAQVGMNACAGGDDWFCQFIQAIAIESLNDVATACANETPTVIDPVTPLVSNRKKKFFEKDNRSKFIDKTDSLGK